MSAYTYDPGPYQGYLHHTDNDKFIAKLDWNVNASNTLSFRWDYLKAKRDLPPHPFVLSFNNTGRGPNESSLPFYKSGYAINNHFHICRDGLVFLPYTIPPGSTFSSLSDFFNATDPTNPNQKNFRALIGTGPYKGEDISVGQVGFYAQDEYPASDRLNLTYG